MLGVCQVVDHMLLSCFSNAAASPSSSGCCKALTDFCRGMICQVNCRSSQLYIAQLWIKNAERIMEMDSRQVLPCNRNRGCEDVTESGDVAINSCSERVICSDSDASASITLRVVVSDERWREPLVQAASLWNQNHPQCQVDLDWLST